MHSPIKLRDKWVKRIDKHLDEMEVRDMGVSNRTGTRAVFSLAQQLSEFQGVAADRFKRERIYKLFNDKGIEVGSIYKLYYLIPLEDQLRAYKRHLQLHPEGELCGPPTADIEQIIYVEYRGINGKPHRIDEPAVLRYSPNGSISYTEYWEYGRKIWM